MSTKAALHTETVALCGALDRLSQQLSKNTLAFEDADGLWRSNFRPGARKLAEALLSFAPDGDPRFVTTHRCGNMRVGFADVVNCIEAPFYKTTACAQLGTIRDQLHTLARNISE